MNYSAGGKAVYNKYGSQYMQELGRRGAKTTWTKYKLVPVGVSGWAMIDKITGSVKAIWGTR